MGTLRGEQIIAQSFKREGVDTIFFHDGWTDWRYRRRMRLTSG
jgi:hypothetical protein